MADAETRARFRFGPRDRRGLVAGVRTGQLAVVAASLVCAVGLARGVHGPSAGVAATGAALAGTGAACWPVRGRTLEQWLPVVLRFLAARPARRSAAPPDARRAPSSRRPPQLLFASRGRRGQGRRRPADRRRARHPAGDARPRCAPSVGSRSRSSPRRSGRGGWVPGRRCSRRLPASARRCTACSGCRARFPTLASGCAEALPGAPRRPPASSRPGTPPPAPTRRGTAARTGSEARTRRTAAMRWPPQPARTRPWCASRPSARSVTSCCSR